MFPLVLDKIGSKITGFDFSFDLYSGSSYPRELKSPLRHERTKELKTIINILKKNETKTASKSVLSKWKEEGL